MTHQTTPQGSPIYTKESAQITVTVNGMDYFGWESSDLSFSMENIARTATIPVTLIPGDPPAIKRQDKCTIRIGDTQLMTGIVLAAEPFYKKDACGLKVVVRDLTGDLIKASAMHKGGQWKNAKLDTIVGDLVKPFGIKVRVLDDVGAPIKEFKLEHGESVLDAIGRVAKKREMIATSNPQGEVVLCRTGKTRVKGAIVRGQNVIEMESTGTDEDRMGEYIAFGQSDVADDFEHAKNKKAKTTDKEITRYLPLLMNAEGKPDQADLQKQVDHQMRVRRGHAYGLQYKIEGWTTLGEAWDINPRIPIYDDIAGLNGEEWLIADIKYGCSIDDGDAREVTVRPIEAYELAPETERKKSGDSKKGAKNAGGRAKGRDGAPLTKKTGR